MLGEGGPLSCNGSSRKAVKGVGSGRVECKSVTAVVGGNRECQSPASASGDMGAIVYWALCVERGRVLQRAQGCKDEIVGL